MTIALHVFNLVAALLAPLLFAHLNKRWFPSLSFWWAYLLYLPGWLAYAGFKILYHHFHNPILDILAPVAMLAGCGGAGYFLRSSTKHSH